MGEETESSALLYFLFGAIMGASLGVLFMPQAGWQTRRQISDWMRSGWVVNGRVRSRKHGRAV